MSDRLKIIMRGFPKFASVAGEETHWLKRSMKTGVRYLSQHSSTVTYRVRTVSAGSYLFLAAEKKSRTFPWLRTEMNYTAHGKVKTNVGGSLSPDYRLRASGELLSAAWTWDGMKSGFRVAGELATTAQTNLYPHIDAYERMKGKSAISAFANVLSKSWIAMDSPLSIQNRLRTAQHSYGVMAEQLSTHTAMFALSRIHAPETILTRAVVSQWDARQTMRAVIDRNSGVRTALSNSKQHSYGRISSPGELRIRHRFHNHIAAKPRNQFRLNTMARPLTGFPVSHSHTLTVRTEQHGGLTLNALPITYTKNEGHSQSFAHLYGKVDVHHYTREKLAANQSTYSHGRIGYGLSREMFAKFGYRVASDDCAYPIRTELQFGERYYGKITRPVYHSASLDSYAYLTAESETLAKTQSRMCAKPRYFVAGKTRGAFHNSAAIFSGLHLYPHLIPLRAETEHRAGIRQYPKLARRGFADTRIHTRTDTYAHVERRLWYGTRTVSTGALYTQPRATHQASDWIRPVLQLRYAADVLMAASNNVNAAGWYHAAPTANALIDEELCIRTHQTARSETGNTLRGSFQPVFQGLGSGRERHGLHALANPLYGYPVRPSNNMLVSTMATGRQQDYAHGQRLILSKQTVIGFTALWALAIAPHQSTGRALGRTVFHNAGKFRTGLDTFSDGAVRQKGISVESAKHMQTVITHAAVNAVGGAYGNADSSAYSLLGFYVRAQLTKAGYTRASAAARYQVTETLRSVGARYAVYAVAGFHAHSLERKLQHSTVAGGALAYFGKGNRPVTQSDQMTAMEHIFIYCTKRAAFVRPALRIPVRYLARPMERQRLSIDTPDALGISGFRIPSKTKLGTTSKTYSSQHYHGQPEAYAALRSEANSVAGFLVKGEKQVGTRARSNSFFELYAGSRQRHMASYWSASHNVFYSQSLEYARVAQHSTAALSFYASSESSAAHTVDTIGRGVFHSSAQKECHIRDRASSSMELGASSDTTFTYNTCANGNVLLPFVFHIPLSGHREVKTSAAIDSHGRERGTVSISNDAITGLLICGRSDLCYGLHSSATTGLHTVPRKKHRVSAQCGISSSPAGEA